MNGTLAYALGLNASGFLSEISKASSGLTSFVGNAGKLAGITALAEGIEHAFKKVFDVVAGVEAVFEKGASLEHLSKRTSESVKNLFMLEKGFKAVGLEADGVGTMIFQMQKALGGVNEMGEDTKSVFAGLGLDIRELKAMNAPQQFMALAKAIAGLDNEKASNVASKIFGRFGAQNFLQLARSSDDFAQALAGSTRQAEIYARNAEIFAKVERAIAKVKNIAKGLYVGIAEGVAPGLLALLDSLSKIDLTGVGLKVGNFVGAIGEAIKQHKIGELLQASLEAGLEGAVEYGTRAIAGLASFMGSIFVTLAPIIGKALRTAFSTDAVTGFGDYVESAMAFLHGDIAMKEFERTGDPKYKTEALAQYAGANRVATEAQDKQAKATAEFKQAIAEAITNGSAAFKLAMGAGLEGATSGTFDRSKRDKLSALLDTLKAPSSESEKKAGATTSYLEPGKFKAEATNLEKMGFVFGSGGPSLLIDHARQTADNTRHTNDLLKDTNKLLGTKTGSLTHIS